MYSVTPKNFFSKNIFLFIGPLMNLFVNPFFINLNAVLNDALRYFFENFS